MTAAAPMGCSFQTGAAAVVNVLKPGPHSSLAVYGTGGVGIAAVMAAHAIGVDTIIAVDLSEQRRQLALSVGATHAFDGARPNLAESIVAASAGGASHAFDTNAAAAVIQLAAKSIARLASSRWLARARLHRRRCQPG